MGTDKKKIIQILERIQKQYRKKVKSRKGTKEVLSFLLGEEMYALDTNVVKEIAKPGKIFSIPSTPDYFKGAVNIRGEVLPVVDLKKFMGLSELNISDKTRIIIAQDKDKIGFLVDSIIDIVHISVSGIQSPVTTMEKMKVDYFDGEILLKDKLLNILNLGKIMSSEKMKKL